MGGVKVCNLLLHIPTVGKLIEHNMLKQERRLGDSPEKCHKELDEVHDAVVLGERNLSRQKKRRGNY